MTAKVILNPYAGRWKALQQKDPIIAGLKAAGLNFELVLTEAPEHGISLAKQAVLDGFNTIIAAGGDGSISEVVNGMVLASLEHKLEHTIPLGVLPLGTANDFMVNLGLPTDIPGAIEVIAGGHTRLIDLGEVTAWSRDGQTTKRKFFDNNSASGFEPSVTLIQQRIKRLRGTLRYLVATLICIGKNPQWTMNLKWNGGTYTGPVSLVTVGNNPLTGGLFYMTPHADPTDGLLTFVHGFMPTRLQILRILPRTMRPGTGSYIEHPQIHEVHSEWLLIESDQPTPVHADGEIMFEDTRHIEYKVLPHYLTVLTHPASE